MPRGASSSASCRPAASPCSASKSGFVSVQYGQTRPFEQGKPIELADKQALDNADIGMPRGGVISGRIVDEFGDAVAGRLGHRDAADVVERTTPLTPAGRIGQTNDLGQYRIYGLPPGDYYVSATCARPRARSRWS